LEIQTIVSTGYKRFRHVGGRVFTIGDAEQEFTIQSISKRFVFALVCNTLGPAEARRKLGVNSTGLPFDSVMGIELNEDRTMNPMVNAGALATTSLVPGRSPEEKFEHIVTALSVFAGRQLVVDEEVYVSEAATNDRNRGIAHLLSGYGRLYCDPDVATDIYTRQCSLRVLAHDLAVMGATLADGGVNPLTGVRAIRRGRAGGSCPFLRPPVSTSDGGLALRRGPAGEERGERGAGDRVPREGRRGDVLATAR
jgi:glutaminase